MRRLWFALLLLPLLGGCLTEANQGDEANTIVTTVHQAFKSGNWDAAIKLYDEAFLTTHSADAWRQKMIKLGSELGALKHVKPTFSQKDPRFRGDFYIYGFLLQFEHGSLSETLTIYKGVDKKRMTITGHDLKLKRH